MNLAILSALILVASVLVHFVDQAWAQATDQAKLIEGAKKEGELVIYGTTDLRQATILNDKFRQKYPFIDVKLNRLTSDNMYPRVIAETRSGKFLSDVLQNNTLGMHFLKRGKFLAHYVSSEDRFYTNDFKDPGYCRSFPNLCRGLAANRSRPAAQLDGEKLR
jgi:ABC-type glycerol-3-phosphate transport system substrate-binding protein